MPASSTTLSSRRRRPSSFSSSRHPGQRSALSVAVLVGGLVLTASGAHGLTQGQVPCTLTRDLIVVDLDNVKHRHILRHTFDARRKGHPRVLHIFREEGPANRRESLRGIPTKKGYDRDEYPPAMADEGGEGASVRYVLSSENRSAGSVMMFQLRPYCDKQRFVIERWRNHLRRAVSSASRRSRRGGPVTGESTPSGPARRA
jgi:hypothetical protein